MSRTRETIRTDNAEEAPLRGQMDIFRYIERPPGYVANERSVKKRRSTVPGQIDMFQFLDRIEQEQERERKIRIEEAERTPLPGQMEILDFLGSETGDFDPDDAEPVKAENITASNEVQMDDDLLLLGEGSLNIGRIMRVLHVSAVEAQRIKERLEGNGVEI